MKAAFGFVILFAMLLVTFPIVSQFNEETRTQEAAATFSCNTGAGVTSCVLTLPTQHEYSDTQLITVSQTLPSPADVTANTAIAGDRVSLTVSSLLELTAYEFDADYFEVSDEVPSAVNEMLKFGGWIFLILIPVGALVVIYRNKFI